MFWGFSDLPPTRRMLVPEVIQTSAMDCGSAALSAILAGFNVKVNYARLREACQTDVDGSSIDTLEDIASQLGLEATQMLLPADHLCLTTAESLPALAVVSLPNGLPHFIVVWRMHGNWVQIMDPGNGRHWVRKQTLIDQLYQHQQLLNIDDWYDWASSDGFCDPLKERLSQLQLAPEKIDQLLTSALSSDWHAMAVLDAATRMLTHLLAIKGIQAGEEASQILEHHIQHPDYIPEHYWCVHTNPDNTQTIFFDGAVIIQFNGFDQPDDALLNEKSPELMAALQTPSEKPETAIWQLLKTDGLLIPMMLFVAAMIAAIGVTLEILVLRGILEITHYLPLFDQRIDILFALMLFLIFLFALELPIATTSLRLGRKLEIRLRKQFLEKLLCLSDHYFSSRLTSDMTQRVYELRELRELPLIVMRFFRLIFRLLLLTLGLIWLSPSSSVLILFAVASLLELSLITQPLLNEQDLRFRTHIGALSRFYFDSLLGLLPIRTHSAQHAVSIEHESLMLEWTKTGIRFFQVHEVISLLMLLLSNGFAIWLLLDYLQQGGEASGALILLYWALQLPVLGQTLMNTAWQYPMMRNRVLRLLEPLSAPNENDITYPENTTPPANHPPTPSSTGVNIAFHDVSVNLANNTILQKFNLNIRENEHLAIVGPSGAGKSTLASLLLGLIRPSSGSIWVNGQLLQSEQLATLRQQTAWVDPNVQLWNRSLTDNLCYGTEANDPESVIDKASLSNIIKHLPGGMATLLGESGGLVSGGEGQRVRLGRAMLRQNIQLVILDEAFRGLDRSARKQLLQNARDHWQQSTLIFISHDISDTQSFDRVLVIENGRIVEDQSPQILLDQATSRYRQLLDAEKSMQKKFKGSEWRRLHLKEGKIIERRIERF